MGVKEKDKSLLEIAVELLSTKHKPQPIMQIAKEAMEIKGLKTAQAKELLPQFLLDFQASGYFVYCGDGCWDLKDRQPTSVLDKDGTDFEIYSEEDEEVKKHELKDDSYESEVRVEQSRDEDEEQEEDDDIASFLKEDGELAAEEGVETGYEEYEGEDDEEEQEY
jgi:DNA-directed RNA polymerase delta subunit